jgi:hypothetical protein
MDVQNPESNIGVKKRRLEDAKTNQELDIVIPGNLLVNGSVRATGQYNIHMRAHTLSPLIVCFELIFVVLFLIELNFE